MAFVLPGTGDRLSSLTELWGHILFWAVVSSATVYVITGLVWAVLISVGQKRWIKVIPFLLFLLSATWKILSSDAIASVFIAGIFVVLEQSLAGEYAILIGVCVSMVTIITNIIVSCCPLYSFL